MTIENEGDGFRQFGIWDDGVLANLRREAERLSLDLTRASIKTTVDGFVVQFADPLFPLSEHYLAEASIPHRVRARTALAAEAILLDGLRRIQLAERREIRIGTCMDSYNVNLQPITEIELERHRAGVQHRQHLADLQKQLADALKRKSERESRERDAKMLQEKYGPLEAGMIDTSRHPLPREDSDIEAQNAKVLARIAAAQPKQQAMPALVPSEGKQRRRKSKGEVADAVAQTVEVEQ